MATIANRSNSSEIRGDASPAHDRATKGNSRFAVVLARSAAWIAIRLWSITSAGLLPRYTAHITILVMVVVAMALSRPAQAGGQMNLAGISDAVVHSGPDQSSLLETFADRGLYVDSNIVASLADAHTTIPSRTRREIQIYTVQAGDTVLGIAAAFGLAPETIMWSNPAIEDDPDLLKIGQEVVILPIDGVYHEVKDGDTLESIAKKYKVDVSAITDVPWNNLTPPLYQINAGMKLIVKDGTKPIILKVVTAYGGPIPNGARGTGQFRWPVIGPITQEFWSGHSGIDISVVTNTPVYAADAGYVSFVGWTDVGYGYLVRINHGNGYETWYAHNTSFAVVLGQQVDRGQVIAYSGSTGHSTGPHVHFEIRYNGVPLNPRLYLP